MYSMLGSTFHRNKASQPAKNHSSWQTPPQPNVKFFEASQYRSISCAIEARLKSVKGRLNALGCCKNSSQTLRSILISPVSLTWWWGLSYEDSPLYNLLVKALPGTIALHRKFKNPQTCCSFKTVVFFFPNSRSSQINCWPFSTLSTGISTKKLIQSSNSPKNCRLVVAQCVLLMETGKFISLQIPMNTVTRWSQAHLKAATNR